MKETMDEKTIQVQAVLYENDKEQLIRALRSVDHAAKEAETQGWVTTLQWGDASPEPLFDTQEWEEIRNGFPHLREMGYRFFRENTGYGRGNNLLASGSTADDFLIMNPEVLLPPRALLDMTEPFRDEQVGLVEARQIPVEHPKEFNPETQETEWASGACFMIPAELFRKLGGFDDRTFFMYCEDVDLSWRVRENGYRLYYQTLTGVFHSRHLSGAGRNQPSSTEQKYTILAEALLAYKWGYPEYARERIRLAVGRGDPGATEAKEEFELLEKMGYLPAFRDPEHRIAHIIQFPEDGGMLFTRHRYQL